MHPLPVRVVSQAAGGGRRQTYTRQGRCATLPRKEALPEGYLSSVYVGRGGSWNPLWAVWPVRCTTLLWRPYRK
jgi:hypothetical protein